MDNENDNGAKERAKGYDPDHDIKTTGGLGGIKLAEAIYQAEQREGVAGERNRGRKALNLSEVNDLDGLGEYIKQEVYFSKRPVEGEISWESEHSGRGINFPITRKYNFFGKVIEETASYDRRTEAEKTALDTGISNLSYRIKPLRIKASSSKNLAKVVIEKD